MERILSSQEMREADNYTINTLNIPEAELVERAGKAVAKEIIKKYKGGRVLVCVGKGNNGKDGEVVAKVLGMTHGFTVSIVNVSNGDFSAFRNKYDIIVDCIFGTGLNREVTGVYKDAIEMINSYSARVVSCDIPSGLNADNGRVLGVCVDADFTVAIQEYKLGHFLNDGIDLCGELVVCDIGISVWGDNYVKRFTNSDVKGYFLPRKRNVNKGSFGKSTVIGGSEKYVGSALLSTMALLSLKMGTGYSTLMIPKSLFSVYAGLNPECIIKTMSDNALDTESLDGVFNNNAIAFGMGMGDSDSVYENLEYVIKNYSGTLIIDADGLNALARHGLDVLKDKKCQIVLTPHVLEFARLIKKQKHEVVDNPINLAKEFAKEYGVVLVLKSAVTVITDGIEVYINTTGCSSMAKAGSGDILSGILVGILANGKDVLGRTVAGAYIFGRAGEIARDIDNEYTVTASDIVKALPSAIKGL